MKVKTRNLIELVFQSVIIVFLFIPGMFSWEFWFNTEWGSWRKTQEEQWSFFEKNCCIATFLGWVLLVLATIAVILFVFQFLSKGEKSNMIYAAFLPAAETAMFGIHALFYDDYVDDWTSYCTYEPSWLFYITSALLVALSVICIVGYFKAKKAGVVDEDAVKKTDGNELSENLINLKQLYDQGLILEEEYEAKRKEYLNIH